MILKPFGRGALAAAALFLATISAAGASAAATPAHTKACETGRAGQPELTPLDSLTLVTARGRYPLKVEFADNDRTREIGLMCRTHIGPTHGMLFDFIQPSDGVAFWMKNTLIPLDIVFIRPDGRVLSIAANARPLDETPLPAGGTIRGVLEIAGGRAAQIGLKPGDQVVNRIFPQ